MVGPEMTKSDRRALVAILCVLLMIGISLTTLDLSRFLVTNQKTFLSTEQQPVVVAPHAKLPSETETTTTTTLLPLSPPPNEIVGSPPNENQQSPKDDCEGSECPKPKTENDSTKHISTDHDPQQSESATTEESGHSNSHNNTNNNKPLNVLLLYADDWRYDSIGTMNPLVHTPFLDKLAQRGIRFTHGCVTTSVCWISRANLYTGQYTSRHNTTKMRKPYWYDHWNDTFPHLLQQVGGYHMGHVGKWHYTDFGRIQHGWDYATVYHGHHWYDAVPPPHVLQQEKTKTTSTTNDATPNAATTNASHHHQPPRRRKVRTHVTTRNEQDAVDFLKTRPTNQPFFLSVCFFAPHCVDHELDQYFPQPSSMERFYASNDSVIPTPFSGTDEAWKRMPHFFKDQNEGRRRWQWRFETAEKFQTMMKNYYRLIAEVDEACERIVQELERQGLVNDTLIIFTTDNGLYHSEHGMAGKWYPHQESIRVPLIVLDPRMEPDKAGTTNDEFVLSIDLAPTILGAAQIEPHARMQGKDFSKLYLQQEKDEEVDDSNDGWRKEFFYEHPMHMNKYRIPASTALVRKDYKYIRWPDFEVEQLFHLEVDPFELNDLLHQDEPNTTTATNTLYQNTTMNEQLQQETNDNYTEILREMRIRHDELANAAK